jgi:hypothetical protein
MLKLLFVVVFLVLALVGGSAVALYHFFGWKGLLAFPVILVGLAWVGKRVAGVIFRRFSLGLLAPKSEVLRKATMTVHSVVPVPVPLPGEGEGKPDEPKHYYDIDVIITPRDSTSEETWEPAELILTSQQITSVTDLQNKQTGFADQVLIWNGAAFGPDDSGKHPSEARLKITFAVTPGTSSAWLHYYNETLGSLELPPWTCENEPPRARFTERTERSRRESAVKSEAQLAAAKQARRGDQFKTGAGKPAPELKLYEPPDADQDESIDLDSPMDEVDAALDRIDARRMDSVPVGASRFGGVPDLPPDLPWPVFKGRKLPFLAQIDLSALPKNVLPAEGWLYVFGLCDDEHVPTPIQVIHYRGSQAELVRASRPAERELWKDWTGNRIYNVVPLKSAKENGWDDCGWLLGQIDEEGEDAAAVADGQDCSGDDWITLMVIPSVGSMMWSDCGLFHIAIRRDDLVRHDFSRVCASLSCVG